MDVVFTHCAGLDVHKKTVIACRVTPDPTGQQADGIMELQPFGTMTRDLLALSDWLAEVGVTHVAMESTGEYWRPVDNLLEGNVIIFLVNAAHVKQVPGRKTDKADGPLAGQTHALWPASGRASSLRNPSVICAT
jgi:transposase